MKVSDAQDSTLEEWSVLQAFIDFVNEQVGYYCDCVYSFEGTRSKIERQIYRVNIPKRVKRGSEQETIVGISLEDPSKPDVIHYRLIRALEYCSINSEAAKNEQKLCWSIIVFIFSMWDEEVRPRLAKIRGVEPNDIQIDVFGDLRELRKNIIHNSGILPQKNFEKLKILKDLCAPNAKIALSHESMHQVFVRIKREIASVMMEKGKHLPGAPNPSEIVSVAVTGIKRTELP